MVRVYAFLFIHVVFALILVVPVASYSLVVAYVSSSVFMLFIFACVCSYMFVCVFVLTGVRLCLRKQ